MRANNRVRLLLNEVSKHQIYLELSKLRFRCKACQQTFVAETPIVKKHCFINKKVRWSIATRLKKSTAMTEIANQKNVSVSSVNRIMKGFYQPTNPFRKQLPKFLRFDEFKSVQNGMSFIMMEKVMRYWISLKIASYPI